MKIVRVVKNAAKDLIGLSIIVVVSAVAVIAASGYIPRLLGVASAQTTGDGIYLLALSPSITAALAMGRVGFDLAWRLVAALCLHAAIYHLLGTKENEGWSLSYLCQLLGYAFIIGPGMQFLTLRDDESDGSDETGTSRWLRGMRAAGGNLVGRDTPQDGVPQGGAPQAGTQQAGARGSYSTPAGGAARGGHRNAPLSSRPVVQYLIQSRWPYILPALVLEGLLYGPIFTWSEFAADHLHLFAILGVMPAFLLIYYGLRAAVRSLVRGSYSLTHYPARVNFDAFLLAFAVFYIVAAFYVNSHLIGPQYDVGNNTVTLPAGLLTVSEEVAPIIAIIGLLIPIPLWMFLAFKFRPPVAGALNSGGAPQPGPPVQRVPPPGNYPQGASAQGNPTPGTPVPVISAPPPAAQPGQPGQPAGAAQAPPAQPPNTPPAQPAIRSIFADD